MIKLKKENILKLKMVLFSNFLWVYVSLVINDIKIY